MKANNKFERGFCGWNKKNLKLTDFENKNKKTQIVLNF